MPIEIPREWFFAVAGAVLGAIIAWLASLFFLLPWRRMQRRLEGLEKDEENLKEDIKKYGEGITSLKAELEKSLETAQNLEQRLAFLADKVGLKGDLLAWGRLIYLEGKLDEAIGTFDRFLEFEPSNDTAHFYRGLCYLRKGGVHSNKAVDDLKIASAANKNDPERRLSLAQAYYQAGMPTEASDQATQALNLGVANRLDAKIIIGRARLAVGDYDAAIEIFKECPLKHSPAVTGWGEALSEKAKQQKVPQDRAKVYKDIIDLYTEAMEISPRASDYHTYRALAYKARNELGDWEKALADWQKARDISPRDSKPWEYEGDALDRRSINLAAGSDRDECLTQAIRCYGEALKRAPELHRPVIRNKRSRIYQYLGEFDKALMEAISGARENPNYVQNFMAWATAAISAYNWKDVVEAADAGLQIAGSIGGNAGRIWCTLYRVIGRCGDQRPLRSNMEDCKSLAAYLGGGSVFEPTAWVWSVAKERLEKAMEDWPDDLVSVTHDSILLVERCLATDQYRAKHIDGASVS